MFGGLSRIVGPPVARRQLPAGGLVMSIGHGRLTVSSTTQLLLAPAGQGNVLTINRRPRIIPAAGLAIANTGLSASTLYYVYCNEGMALELSTTAPVVDALSGLKVKSGDPTRTLVGMTFTNASSQFVDIQTVSWFDRRDKAASASSSSISNSAQVAAITFATWGDEAASLSYEFTDTNGTANAINTTQHTIDGTGVGVAQRSDTNVTTGGVNACGAFSVLLSEGAHTYTMLQSTNGSFTSTSAATYVRVKG